MEVVLGEIRVARVTQLLDHAIVKVWQVELGSKFASVLGYHRRMVYLKAGARTTGLNNERRGQATIIDTGLLRADWDVMAEVDMYNMRIIALRLPADRDPVLVWQLEPVGSGE